MRDRLELIDLIICVGIQNGVDIFADFGEVGRSCLQDSWLNVVVDSDVDVFVVVEFEIGILEV